MLSYQHIYHAGNLADVHKHALLSWCLNYMTKKDKPISYIETHAGRGSYDLTSPEAQKTGEAQAGILRLEDWFAPDHPYRRALKTLRQKHGAMSYPGSPMIAQELLRDTDIIHLAERHPGEYRALRGNMARRTKCYHQNGFDLAFALLPPEPRRGLMLIDPSYEDKADYAAIPTAIRKYAKIWPVGVIALWYPILKSKAHHAMCSALENAHPGALRSEVAFAPARPGHGMIGSGLFIINAPYGASEVAAELRKKFLDLLSANSK